MQLSSRTYDADNIAAVQELYHSNGWTDGLPIVPRGAVPAGRNLRAVPLEPRLVRRIGVIALREREPTPAAAGFLALLRREWPRQN